MASQNEHGRVMQNSYGKLEPLLYAKRQVRGKLISDILQVILLEQLLDPAINLVWGQMIEMSSRPRWLVPRSHRRSVAALRPSCALRAFLRATDR
jgi:hypothetical protein